MSITYQEAIAYSHNYATAKPDIGATEREHILGLCQVLEAVGKERDALAAHVEQINTRANVFFRAWDTGLLRHELETLRSAIKDAPSTSHARRDNEQFRQGFWWGFERARCNPEAMNIRAEFEEVQRLRRQSKEAPCSSTSESER